VTRKNENKNENKKSAVPEGIRRNIDKLKGSTSDGGKTGANDNKSVSDIFPIAAEKKRQDEAAAARLARKKEKEAKRRANEEKRAAENPIIGQRMPDGTVYAGDSPETMEPMFVMPNDSPGYYRWNEAKEHAKKINSHGHNDWRLPTSGELSEIYNNRAKIGGFKNRRTLKGHYWTSEDGGGANKPNYALNRDFWSGECCWSWKIRKVSVRFVRS
jgi:hypothetical protein